MAKDSNDDYDSDDGASETSSTCSDSSYWICGRQLTEVSWASVLSDSDFYLPAFNLGLIFYGREFQS